MILVFPSSNFLTDRCIAVLLYLCSSLTYILVCAFQPCGHLLGKVAKAVVAGPAGPELLVPLFWLCFPPCPFFSFWLIFLWAYLWCNNIYWNTPNVAHVINRPCQGIITSSHRNIGYLFFCFFTSHVNSYGHCGTVSSLNHTFSWAGLSKRLTRNLCTYFRL